VKAGWIESTLGEVCALIKRGGAPRYIEEGGVCVVNQKCVRNHEINFDLARRTDPCQRKINPERYIQIGDVLVNSTGTGTLGRVAQIITQPAEQTTVDTHVTIVRPKPNNFFLPFFGYMMIKIEEEITSAGHGASGQTELSRKDLENKFKVSYPICIEEQRRIVAVLDEAFTALDRARENVKSNLADAEELLSALVDFEVLKSDETWSKSSIGEVIDIVGGSQPPKSEFVYEEAEGLIRLIQIRDYKSNKNIVFIPKEKARRFCEPEEVMIARYGPPIFQILRGLSGAYNVALMKAVPKNTEQLSNEFLFYFLKNRPLLEYVINASSRAAGQSGVNKAGLYPYSIAFPDLQVQTEICERLEQHERLSTQLIKNYKAQLADLSTLRQSLLERAFAGELTQAAPNFAINDNERDERLSTATLVLTYEKHRLEERHKTFGTVKAQKTLHLMESVGDCDLGRQPEVRQAGPHDQEHFDRVEAWAAQRDVFRFVQRRTGQRGYDFVAGKNYDAFLSEAKILLADHQADLSRFLPLMTRMNTEQAEVFTTVHAAWNNLLADGEAPSDDEIVYAAREGWHESKLNIDRQKFFDAIREIRRHDLVPDGRAKYVHGVQESLL